MIGSILQKYVLPAVIIVAGFAAIIGLSGFIQRRRPPLPDGFGDTDLSINGSRLKGFALGTEGLMADWYYMRALQYIGDKMLNSKNETVNIDDLRDLNPLLLYPLLNTATDLDPHFIAAYSYGAMVLPAIDAQKAIDLTTKGITNNPDSWRLYQYLGYIYWKLGRYDKAAESYEKGSEIGGSPPFMKLMAASMTTHGGTRDTARAIYQEMLQNSGDEQVRITAKRRLGELDSLDEREAIDKALSDFKDKNGHCPDSFNEILSTLMKVDLPGDHEFSVDVSNRLIDPTGAPYVLDKDKCKIKLDIDHTDLPVL